MEYFFPGGSGRDFSASVRDAAYFSLAAIRASVRAVILGSWKRFQVLRIDFEGLGCDREGL